MAEWTRKRARQTLRRVAKINDSLGQLAYNWGDLDQTIISQVDEIVAELDALNESMDESVLEEAERELEEDWQMALTEQELKALGRFLEAYGDEWEFCASLAGMTFDEAEETRKKLQDR